MKYDFDSVIDRRGTESLKWDVGNDELAMWVADMDFRTAPPVIEAIRRRAEHGVFGYSVVPEAWADAYISHWENRYSYGIGRDSLIFTTGIVPAISSMVRKLTTPAEKVLIQTPVYNIFFNSILNNGRVPLEAPLVYEGPENGYSIDFDALEKGLSDPQVSLMILCNPHNPVGRIWSRDELGRIGELCAAHGVTVISDEIHCDLTPPGETYVPFASVSETCRDISAVCISPTKSFNIAGLQTAAVSVHNPLLRHKVWRALNTDEVAEGNVFAADAAIAAYSPEGEEYLDGLKAYINANREFASAFIRKEIPGISMVKGNATYLLWLDFSRLSGTAEDVCGFLRKNTGLYISEGSQFGKGGERFARLNAACPRVTLQDGLERLKRGIEAYSAR